MCLALTWIGREGKEVSLGHVSLRSHRNGCWRKKYFVYLALHSIFMKCVKITSRLACVQKLAYSLKWYSYAFLVMCGMRVVLSQVANSVFVDLVLDG